MLIVFTVSSVRYRYFRGDRVKPWASDMTGYDAGASGSLFKQIIGANSDKLAVKSCKGFVEKQKLTRIQAGPDKGNAALHTAAKLIYGS